MNFKWKGYNWRTGQPWGDFHPDFTKSWYSPNTVKVENDVLKLTIKKDHKTFKTSVEDSETVLIPYGVGLVTCIEEFGYGTFEWSAKLANGKDIVCALWLASNQSWPPEIDCVEAFTNNKGSYNHRLLWRRIEPNIHYIGKSGHEQRGGKRTCRFLFKINKTVDFKIIFTPNKIDVYYNNKRVMHETREVVLQDFKDVKFFPIMNINVMKPYLLKNLKEESVFEIHDFKFTEYEKKG